MYEISNAQKHFRSRTKSVVITHMRSLYEKGTFIKPTILTGSFKYTWGSWQEYFHKTLLKKRLPVHYFVEELGRDYAVLLGLSFPLRSYFMADLADARAVPYEYRDALLIGVGEDYGIDTVDQRMVAHVSDKLLSGLMREYRVQYNEIVKLDDVLLPGWEERVALSTPYDVRPMPRFDPVVFRNVLKEYFKG